MGKLQNANLFRTYYIEAAYSGSPRRTYGRARTRIKSSWAINQVEAYPLFSSKDVSLQSGEINLTKADFRDAKVSLSASRSISTGTTDAIVKTGSKSDVFRSGQSIQFWQGTSVVTGGGDDAFIIDNTNPLTSSYLGDIMLVAGSMDTGEGNDLIEITVYNQNTLFGSNDPGLELRQGYFSPGILQMGNGEDKIVIDSPGNSYYSSSALGVNSGCTLDLGAGNDMVDLITGGMSINGRVDMGTGDDKFIVRSVQGKNGAWVQRGDYPLDPIIDGGEGLDVIGVPDGTYTVSEDSEGVRIWNGIGAGWELSVDITVKSFELVSGSNYSQAVALKQGTLEVIGGLALYTT